MRHTKLCFVIFVLPLFLLVSCTSLQTRGAGLSYAVNAEMRIFRSSAIVKIDGKINENLYYPGMPGDQKYDLNYYDQPAVTGGTITRNEIQHLTTGDEYKFSLLPTEVVTMNIVSADGNDVEIIVRQYEKEKTYGKRNG